MNEEEVKNQILEYNNNRFNKRYRLYIRRDSYGILLLTVRDSNTKEDISYFKMDEVIKAGNIPALMYLYKKGLIKAHPIYTKRERLKRIINKKLENLMDRFLGFL